METNIGVGEQERSRVARTLLHLLADEYVLYTKTRNAHWNTEGPDFHSMHLFFEAQYRQLDEIIDIVAERIRALGHYVPATLNGFLQQTHLTELSREKNDSKGFIRELLVDHESIIIEMREHINEFATDLHDAGTSDLITGLLEQHEKMAWMLRAHQSK